MLSESALESLIQPIIARQESINNYVVQMIAKRIKEIGGLKPSDVYKLERLLKTGNDVKKINEELAKLTGLQEKEIKKLIRQVAKDAYKDTKPFYDYRHKSFIPFEENTPLQRVVKAVETLTLGSFKNLSRSTATGFLIRDLKHPGKLKFVSIKEAYISVIDEAIQAAQSGTIDYGAAMRNTLKQLVNSGVRKMSWDTGYTQRLDTAVRRNVLDGIRAVNQGVQDETGKQFGADGKEITVHANSAPDHEPVQGHQFTNEEFEKLQSAEPFEDVNGVQFEPIERAIGTLNCYHFTYSIIIGHAKPNFTQEQLDEYKRKNAEGYTLPNGKHLTMYECTQRQRKMETEIRRAKEGQMAAREAGDEDLAKQFQAEVNEKTAKYNAFSDDCGLSRRPDKLSVPGYHKIKA